MFVLVLDLWAATKVTQPPLRPPLTISSSRAIKAGRVAYVAVGGAMIALALKFRSLYTFSLVKYNALSTQVVWLFGSRQPVRSPKQISHTSSLPFLKLLLLPPFKFLYTLFLLLYHLLGSPSNEHLWLRSWPFSGGVSPFADFFWPLSGILYHTEFVSWHVNHNFKVSKKRKKRSEEKTGNYQSSLLGGGTPDW